MYYRFDLPNRASFCVEPTLMSEPRLINEIMNYLREFLPVREQQGTLRNATAEAVNPEVKKATPAVKVSPEEIFKAEELGLIEREGRIMVSSRNVARIWNKRHNDVLRSIRTAECSSEFRVRNFAQSSYKNAQGKSQPEYFMTKDGFTFLVMGFTGKLAAKFKEAYINAFNAMEAMLRSKQISA